MTTAEEILGLARARGVSLSLDGDMIRIDADERPPEEFFDLIARWKQNLIAELKRRDAIALEWREVFNAHAACVTKVRLDAGPAEVERIAFAWTLEEFLRSHPIRSSPDRCVHCGGLERPADVLLPFGTDSTSHAWLHDRCWAPWRERRREAAVEELAALGLSSRRCESAPRSDEAPAVEGEMTVRRSA
jgi:hypothetical protein